MFANRHRMPGIRNWILVIAGLLALDALLYFGQGFLHREEVRRARVLDAHLDSLDTELEQTEAWLSQRARQSDYIDRLRDSFRKAGADSATKRDAVRKRRSYRELVEDWNAGLPALKSQSAHRDSLLELYNGLIGEYNVVARKAYSRWMLLPLPGMRGFRARAGREGVRHDPESQP